MTDFKTKMAELAKKYNITHQRDIDRHNFVYEVEQLSHPELAESEDEKIRKALIDGVRQIRCKNGITQEQMITYLEKQKETADSFTDNVIEVRSFQRGIAEGRRLERQKEHSKSADSISSDCTTDAKCDDRWHKVADFLPDSGRDVLAKDALGNYLLASFDGDQWFVSVYDGEDKPIVYTPAIKEWCDIPSEKQKEQKPKVKGYGVMRKMEDPHPVDWYMDENGKEHCWGYKFNEPCPWPAEVYIMEAKEDKK